jgi:DNA-binding transcriptional MerR regulator
VRGGGVRSGAAPAARPWTDRIEDPTEPLFTIGVAADLLETDQQTLRRLEDALSRESARPSGNQRRYSRHDLEALDAVLQLVREGHPPGSAVRIAQLEQRVDELT